MATTLIRESRVMRATTQVASVIRVLLIGCGDVALRTARPAAHRKVRLYGLTRRADDVAKLRAHGIVPDRRRPRSLAHASTACARRRSRCCISRRRRPTAATIRARSKLIAALARARIIPQRFVYISTSGVYGDCAGARVAETRPRRAQTPRARRRVAAEDRLRAWARALRRRARRSCARPASTRRRGCRSSASGRARRCSRRTTTCSPITSTPTISRAPPSPRCSAASPTAPTTSATTPS